MMISEITGRVTKKDTRRIANEIDREYVLQEKVKASDQDQALACPDETKIIR